MRKLFLCVYVALCAHLAHAQPKPTHPHPEPIVAVDNIILAHEHKGWRVVNLSTPPHANLFTHFNLLKGDLIIRIDGKNAAETGPMQMAGLLNEGDRLRINLFIERGMLRMETQLREIRQLDYDPVGTVPFKSVASGFSAPDAEFKDIDGQPVTLEQFKGKWLLIDFMATWCAECMEQLPNVLNVTDHNQLSLLAIALNDKTEAVRHMQQSYKIDSPIATMYSVSQLSISFGITMPVEFGTKTNRSAGQIPALVLIRPTGEIALIDIGGLDGNQIEKVIPCVMSCKADQALNWK